MDHVKKAQIKQCIAELDQLTFDLRNKLADTRGLLEDAGAEDGEVYSLLAQMGNSVGQSYMIAQTVRAIWNERG
jgi:hypothetical protein